MFKNNAKEIKIGITFIVAVAILFFGLNFLKGINIFSSSNRYFAVYKDIGGLVISNPVNIKGYKVGQVRKIRYDFESEVPFVVELAIKKDIKLPKGTVFVLDDEGLIGGKIIDVKLGSGSDYYSSNDTIPTDVAENFMSHITQYIPNVSKIINNLDSISTNINTLTSDVNLRKTIASLRSTMDNINSAVVQLKQGTASLPSTMSKLNSVATNLDTKVGRLDVDMLMTKVNQTLNGMENFTRKLNDPNSSLGLLLSDRALYDNLNSTVQNANSLMIDLKANPKRYVNISVFGSKK